MKSLRVVPFLCVFLLFLSAESKQQSTNQDSTSETSKVLKIEERNVTKETVSKTVAEDESNDKSESVLHSTTSSPTKSKPKTSSRLESKKKAEESMKTLDELIRMLNRENLAPQQTTTPAPDMEEKSSFPYEPLYNGYQELVQQPSYGPPALEMPQWDSLSYIASPSATYDSNSVYDPPQYDQFYNPYNDYHDYNDYDYDTSQNENDSPQYGPSYPYHWDTLSYFEDHSPCHSNIFRRHAPEFIPHPFLPPFKLAHLKPPNLLEEKFKKFIAERDEKLQQLKDQFHQKSKSDDPVLTKNEEQEEEDNTSEADEDYPLPSSFSQRTPKKTLSEDTEKK